MGDKIIELFGESNLSLRDIIGVLELVKFSYMQTQLIQSYNLKTKEERCNVQKERKSE